MNIYYLLMQGAKHQASGGLANYILYGCT